MNNIFIKSELNKIINNPGTSIEELKGQVKTLATLLLDIENFINYDLANAVEKEIARKTRLRSS